MSQHTAAHAAQNPSSRRRRGIRGWSVRAKIGSSVLGALMAGGVAFAVTTWVVGLGAGSSGQAESGTVSNITITAVASPVATNLLFPGGTGDVVAKITNPNAFPVTITSVNLPTNLIFGGGFSDSALTLPQVGCTTTTSAVAWSFATSTSGSVHTLTTPITVGANANFTVTFVNDASMGLTTPVTCESTFFSMPSLTGVVASAGAATSTVATTDAWTS
jgi:hypothetical protein